MERGTVVDGSFVCGLPEDPAEEEEWERVFARLEKARDAVAIVPRRAECQKYCMDKVEVLFPYEAYKSQKQLMSKAIEGVNRVANCLLESPTGTGKTAALLCALLGWQQYCRKNNFTDAYFGEKVAAEAEKCTCGLVPDRSLLVRTVIEDYRDASYVKKYRIKSLSKIPQPDDGVEMKKVQPEKVEEAPTSSQTSPPKFNEITKEKDDLCRYCLFSYFTRNKIPRIFYATRTHCQIQQIVDQLKDTPYRHTPMTILGSRNTSCINEELKKQIEDGKKKQVPRGRTSSKMSQPIIHEEGEGSSSKETPRPEIHDNLDEGCRSLRKAFFKNVRENEGSPLKDDVKDNKRAKAETCKYFDVPNSLQSKVSQLFEAGAWDIEEMKQEGEKCEACPYYASQALLGSARIVFCPYNYLISPKIRAAVGADLNGSVVVFDEAHNLEDICRSAASTAIDLDRLDIVRLAIDSSIDSFVNSDITPKMAAAQYFSMILQRLSTWIKKNGPKRPEENIYATPPRNKAPPYNKYEGQAILDMLESIGLGKESAPENWNFYKELTTKEESDEDKVARELREVMAGEKPKEKTKTFNFTVPSVATRFIEELLFVLDFVHKGDNYLHYNFILVNSGYKLRSMREVDVPQQPKTHSQGSQQALYFDNIIFEVMCLNPAIAFRNIRDNAHSIIVASGTLSPLNSFAVELDTPFKIQLTASHVIEQNQTLTAFLKFGSGRKELQLNKDGQFDPVIQDDLGHTILEICQTVPHGVLVFLPSYGFMDTLKQRWSQYPAEKSLLKQLEEVKYVFYEERKNKENFEKDMFRYKDLIENPPEDCFHKTGCILFAIFRGKVSEGINFTDNHARAVITIGIPFANVGSHGVACKKQYNDKCRQTAAQQSLPGCNNLISGHEWYNIQAFRAMNQAFGRCIRHKNDWGAIILLESRLRLPSYQDKLSSWVKKDGLKAYGNFNGMKSDLISFVEERIKATSRSTPVKQPKQAEPELDDEEDNDEEQGIITEDKYDFPTQVISSPRNRIDLDSSAYSLDEDDCIDMRAVKKIKLSKSSRSHSQQRSILNIHELPTQIISNSSKAFNSLCDNNGISDDDDISYHSSNGSSSSIEFFNATP